MHDRTVDVHADLIWLTWHPGTYPSEGAKHYIRRGKEIPDLLLPGRTLMRIKKNDPKYFEKIINTNWKNAAPWWVKVMCG